MKKNLQFVTQAADRVSEIFSNNDMEATMVKQQTTAKGRWLLLMVLSLASIVFTGCEKGSLGIKAGSITGYVLNSENNQPVPDVLIKAVGTISGATGQSSASVYTGGDGSFTLNDLSKGSWVLTSQKFGWAASSAADITVYVNNGETAIAPVMKITKTETLVKGVLRGYPIDAITGRPLRNFTVTQTEPYNQRKSRLFETAEDFRDIGWSGLEGGNHHYTITCNNYTQYSTAANSGQPISIGASPVNLGVIKISPLTVSIAGTLRNLPGYILEASPRDIVIWAEAAGKVVATYTDASMQGNFKGTISYTLDNIPVSAGSVTVKCKIRGYDLQTINSAVSLASNMPGGIIAGVDLDFANVEPIKRDLRIVVMSSAPSGDNPGTFTPGEVARVYIRQGGKDIVPYVDVVSVNYRAEAYISGVITGYQIQPIAVNMNRGFNSAEGTAFTLQEDGNSAYTITLTLK